MNPRALRWLSVLACLPLCGGVALAQVALPASTPALMPMPASIEVPGGSLELSRGLAVSIVGHGDNRIRAAVQRALDRLARQTGGAVRGRVGPGPGVPFVVRAEEPAEAVPSLGENESYTLTLGADGIALEAPNTLGVLRGLETFLQLVELTPGGFAAPHVRIADAPRFPWRGLLIDVGRHWIPPHVIKRNLDAMAAVKMNVLHWHLTEDQGFRIESKRFPKLHELGSGGDYFTQDQVREIVAYAADRGIRVVPEFDMPGHSTSWFVGHPELASLPGPYEVDTEWGIADPAMDPSREQVYEFLAEFIEEMARLFPDAYLHIGGDEVTGVHWEASEAIQRFMAEQGIRDNHDLQAHFNRRVQAILAANGKRMVGWQEVIHPGLSRSTVVQSWRGHESLFETAADGYGGILSWGYYLDLMHTAAEHYAVDPLGHPSAIGLTAEARQRVLGGEACMWSELVTAETIDSRIWPRGAAIAERLWSPASVTDPDDMYRRMDRTSRWLQWTGVTHRSGYRPMLERIAGGQSTAALEILADVVVPPCNYDRNRNREYNVHTAHNVLADAARPESKLARELDLLVKRYVEGRSPADAARLRSLLSSWRDHHEQLLPLLRESPLLVGVEPVSADLSALATLGLVAVARLQGDLDGGPGWDDEQAAVLVARAKRPRASLRIAVAEPIERLLSAARNVAPPRGER